MNETVYKNKNSCDIVMAFCSDTILQNKEMQLSKVKECK